jgi:hypothetical protein
MKKLLIGVVVFLLVVVGAVIFVGSKLDGIVKTAIETYGSQATQTQVSVAAVKIKLRDGAGSISGLNVGNPKGFTDPDIFKLGSISTKIDTSTVTKNPVVIDEITISSPQVFYEIDKQGASNLDALKQNLAGSSSSSSTSSSEESSGGKQIKVIIHKLVVEGGQANMRIAALGEKQQTVNLPRIELTDIGQKSGGATALEVAKELSNAMLKNVQGAVMQAGVQQYLGKSVDMLKQGAVGKLGGAIGGAAGGAGGQLGGAINSLLGK